MGVARQSLRQCGAWVVTYPLQGPVTTINCPYLSDPGPTEAVPSKISRLPWWEARAAKQASAPGRLGRRLLSSCIAFPSLHCHSVQWLIFLLIFQCFFFFLNLLSGLVCSSHVWYTHAVGMVFCFTFSFSVCLGLFSLCSVFLPTL